MRQKAELTVSGFRRLNALASCCGDVAAPITQDQEDRLSQSSNCQFLLVVACPQNNKKQGVFGAREGETR